jgi:hypothetical protein
MWWMMCRSINWTLSQGQQSAEMLERCLFALEGSWHPWFAAALANGRGGVGQNLGLQARNKTSLARLTCCP